jgi:hypothetical protein
MLPEPRSFTVTWPGSAGHHLTNIYLMEVLNQMNHQRMNISHSSRTFDILTKKIDHPQQIANCRRAITRSRCITFIALLLFLGVLPEVSAAQEVLPCSLFSAAELDSSQITPWLMSILNCTAVTADCNATQCSDCRYIGIEWDDTCCCIPILQLSGNGSCFCACGVQGLPVAYGLWSTTGGNYCSSKDSYVQAASGWGLGCKGKYLQLRICGTFPMSLTISFGPNSGSTCFCGPCTTTIRIE